MRKYDTADNGNFRNNSQRPSTTNNYNNMQILSVISVVMLLAVTAPASANLATQFESAGVLDRPLPATTQSPGIAPVVTTLDPATPVNPEVAQENLRREFEQEQEALQQLPEKELQQLAEQGERAAQVVLAENFAREAAMLAFAPAAANDALSDAVRWYSLAASRGYPGAPSLDHAGVQFFPIRVQRARP